MGALLPASVRLRFAIHLSSNCSFNASKVAASGTGVRQLRRNHPSSPSTPPFSFPFAGLQYALSYPQCERNAMMRSVSTRCRQNLLHHTRHIVVAQCSEHAPKVVERILV